MKQKYFLMMDIVVSACLRFLSSEGFSNSATYCKGEYSVRSNKEDLFFIEFYSSDITTDFIFPDSSISGNTVVKIAKSHRMNV